MRIVYRVGGYTTGGVFFSTDDVTISNRIMAYLASVYRARDSYGEETLREAVRLRTVENLKHIDLEKYKVKRSITLKALLGEVFILLIFPYFA